MKEGASVYGLDRAQHIVETERRLQQGGGRFRAFCVDVTDHSALRDCVERIVAQEARLDILVNNAAIVYYEDLASSTLEHWRQTYAVNIEAQDILSQLTAPHMARRGWGRIINIASTQALATEPKVGAYCTSKGERRYHKLHQVVSRRVGAVWYQR